MSGKVLGSILLLTNDGKDEQIIELCTDSISKYFETKPLLGQAQSEELPFQENKKFISNSEVDYSCWFIENPVSKELCKSLTLRISGKSS